MWFRRIQIDEKKKNTNMQFRRFREKVEMGYKYGVYKDSRKR